MRLDLSARHALLLQGPVGPFFRRFADELIARGIAVTKVNFNPGDALFFRGPEVISFREPVEAWPQFFRELVAGRGIDAVFLFGDIRPIHRHAIEIAGELDIPVWVFEEGYLRPDYVTLERGGVNGHSPMPKDPDFYRRVTADLDELPPPAPVGNTFPQAALYAALHSCAVTAFSWRYPHYHHHRDINAFKQGFFWARGFTRKLWYASREKTILDKARGEWSGRYFFVPLQVHCDAQIHHSSYGGIEEFIEEVVATFAAHAPADHRLVLKHHPHDRAYRDYGRFMRELGQRHGCEDRLVYVHDLHLPTLLKNARGTVTMNSTVGISSLHHDTPVKVLGRAVYDLPQLTFQGDLAEFFHDPGEVDRELYAAFCRWLRESSQLNGSFYRRAPGVDARSGVRLPVGSADESGGESALGRGGQ